MPLSLMPPKGVSASAAEVIDVDHAGLRALGTLVAVFSELVNTIRRQAERQAVGASQHFVGVGEAYHRRQRAEGFFGHQHGVVGQLGDHGRAEEVALAVRASPSSTTLPPCLSASSTKVLMAGTRRSCASGPMSVPFSRPSPTLMFLSTSVKRARNCS